MTTVWIIFACLIALVAVLVYLPTFLESRRFVIDDAKRAEAPGNFADLSQGKTHYRWFGGGRGPVAVMIHGLTTSSPVWDDLAETMVDLGYRVLVYDLYGRGYSDSVDGAHDTQMYLQQLDDLLADQGLDENLTIVGYSMGGTIATAFAATEPHRMMRLILLASAGVDMVESDFAKFCRTKGMLGRWRHGLQAAARFRQQAKADAYAEANPHIYDTQMRDAGRRGFFPAILACRAGILGEVQDDAHRAITRDSIPTIAIWGEDDPVIPLSSMGKVTQWNRRAHHEVIEEAGHELPYSHVAEVSDILRLMLREQKPI